MATAKPKVKRMMLGGAALGAVKKAVTSKAAPMQTQSKMQAAAKSAAQQAAFKPMPPQVRSAPTPEMAARAQMGAQEQTQRAQMQGADKRAPAQLASLAKAYNAQKSGKMGMGSAAMGAARGISRGDLKMAGLMKKGGAVKKKATKK